MAEIAHTTAAAASKADLTRPRRGGGVALPFAPKDRWIVTVESERRLVKVRHRTRWYTVARRIGHDERRHWCASREDALVIAEWQREGFEQVAFAEYIEAMLARLTPIQRARAIQKLIALASTNEP